MPLSKSQIDRLGERLKKGDPTEADLRLLDEYRRSFGEAYDSVIRQVREKLTLSPTGRRAKTTPSIIDKLRRESIRLSQIQDIAGCRLIVSDLNRQDHVTQRLSTILDNPTIVDRRVKPSYGYRAVHIVVQQGGRLVEIQVRTLLQHVWAQLSEKMSDSHGIAVKYGGGTQDIREVLESASSTGAVLETLEQQQENLEQLATRVAPEHPDMAALSARLSALAAKLNDVREQYLSMIQQIIREGLELQ